MDVTTKVEKTYNLLNISETQAEDLLKLCSGKPEYAALDIRDDSIQHTMDSMRQALLSAGALLPKGDDDES